MNETDDAFGANEFELALLSKYGKIIVAGEEVISAKTILNELKEKNESALQKTSDAGGGPNSRSITKGPYKVSGSSTTVPMGGYWRMGVAGTDMDKLVGGIWWDTPAGYIAVQVYFFDKGCVGCTAVVREYGPAWGYEKESVARADKKLTTKGRLGVQAYHSVSHAGYEWQFKTSYDIGSTPLDWGPNTNGGEWYAKSGYVSCCSE